MSELFDRLYKLSHRATPGKWKAEPKRLMFGGQEGPLMSYLVGNRSQPEGMVVSLGSERVADHEFVAELVNAWREGKIRPVDSTDAAHELQEKP